MENLLFSLSVVLPLVLMMIIGYFLRKINIFTNEFTIHCNKVCFEIFLPCLVFYSIYMNGAGDKEEMHTVGYAMISSIILIVILLITVPFVIKDRKKAGAMIQGMFRNNALVFGVPLVMNLYGPDGIGPITVIISAIVPVYNFAAVAVLSSFDPTKKIDRTIALKVTVDIIKNPLIISAIIGLMAVYTHIYIPKFLISTIGSIADITTPLALISLGAGFQFNKLSGNMRYILFVSIFKMIFMPAVMVGIAVALGFRETQLVAILALYATPIAVSSYIMAKELNSDHILAGQLVIMTNLFSVFTIFIFVYILRILGYI